MANYPSREQLSRTIAKAYFDERTERGAFAAGSDRAADEVLRLITSLNGPKVTTGSHREAVEAAARMIAGEHRGYSFYEHPFGEADREHHRSEAVIAVHAFLEVLATESALTRVVNAAILPVAEQFGLSNDERTVLAERAAESLAKHLRGTP